MDTQKAQAEFEEKMAAMHKRYKKIRWRIRLIWLIYTAVSLTLLILFLMPRNIVIFWAAVFLSFTGSVVLMSFRLKLWQQQEKKQEELLIEQAPVGRIRL